MQAIYGAGGVGKTHLALEYAYRYRESFGLIVWLPADEANTLDLQFARLADRLNIASGARRPGKEMREAVHRELSKRNDWLLIFDNAISPQELLPYLPTGGGSVLITSRHTDWVGVAQSFCLRVLERAESRDFLLRRTGLSDPRGAATLAQALGDLPLALEQAAALITEANYSFADYLRMFENHWAELLQSGRSSGDYPDTVAMTWELSCREVEADNSEVAGLLKILAYLAPSGITRSQLRTAAANLPVPLSTRFGSAEGLDNAIATLRRYSLLAADDRAVFVHYLIGLLTRDRLPLEQRHNWCEVALAMMQRTFHFEASTPLLWADCAEWLPHALAATEHAEAAGVAPAINSKLLNSVGEYLHQIGRLEQARSAFERALALNDQAHGASDPRRAAVINNLGRVLRRTGNLEQARAHFENALVLDQATYGESHPHVAEVVNNYAAVLYESGEAQTALKQFEWALEVCLKSYGPDHPKVATVINNVGYSLASIGSLDKAMEHFTHAVAIAEAAYGTEHPLVASIRTNMGIVLRLSDKQEAAQAQFERAARIQEGTLGPDHSDLARTLAHMGSSFQLRGDLQGAKRCFQRALEIDERVLGADSFLIVSHLNELGRCLKALGEVDASAKCYQRAAALVRKSHEHERASA